MATLGNIKISLRKDTLVNWTAANPVLNNGELAIVVGANGNMRFKVGDGSHAFAALPFMNENELQTKELSADHISVKSISQGLRAAASSLGFAAGAFLSANADFSQALGYNAQTDEEHQYAFVWNGDASRALFDYYTSNGAGTFNINPASGINGFYIGDKSLSTILGSSFYQKSETSSAVEIADQLKNVSHVEVIANNEVISRDLSVITLSQDEYYDLVTSGSVCASALYIVSSDAGMNAYGQTISNVGDPVISSDAANKAYVDDAMNKVVVPTKTSELTNDSGFLTAHQSLTAYATKAYANTLSSSLSSTIDTKMTQMSQKLTQQIQAMVTFRTWDDPEEA